MSHTFLGVLGYDVRLNIKEHNEDPVFASFVVEAYIKRTLIGALTVLRSGIAGYPSVEYIEVNAKYRRAGVGTKLYEKANEYCCATYGMPLASGSARSEAAEAFWYNKYLAGEADQHDNPLYDPNDEDPVPDTREDFYTMHCPA